MNSAHEKTFTRGSEIFSVHRKEGGPKIPPCHIPRSAGNDASLPKKEKAFLTQEELKRLLHYNPHTGVFTWRVKTCKSMEVGAVAGTLRKEGYWRISIYNKLHYAHRLAWLYVYGHLPPQGVDHRDGVKSDNRLSNLRIANKSENGQNRYVAPVNGTSGFLGVSLAKNKRKWRATIKIGQKQIHLGQFPTPREAHQAYLKAKREIHPFCMI